MIRRFPWRVCLVALLLIALMIATIPFAGFRTRAVSSWNAYEQSLIAAGFPESYVPYLNDLHNRHPNWIFTPYHTGLNWASAVSAECSGGRSLVVSAANEIFKSKAAGCYDASTGAYTFVESGYVTASEFAVSYFMDPRNFLREEYILQFESLVYHASDNELQVIQNILSGTVLTGDKITYKTSTGATNTIDISYAEAILQAGQTYGVNPFFLASKIRDEVGSGGSTISGTVPGYEGLYNFYNIYAYGSNSIEQSLAWAGSGTTYNRPWTTPVRSIFGGAEYIAEGYIQKGQTTSYFQRFNVVSSPYYNHQYMTAIRGAAEEALNSYKALSSTALDAARSFTIPVYENMPQSSAKLAENIAVTGAVSTGTANASVNLRTSPTTSVSNKSGKVLAEGTQVTITEQLRSSGTDFLKYPYWYHVSYSGGDGYVCADYVNVSYSQNPASSGTVQKLSLSLIPSDATEVPSVSSSDSGVAAVNSNGQIVCQNPGIAYITATLNNGARAIYCTLVTQGEVSSIIPVTDLSLNAESLTLSAGETFQLAAQIFPQDATVKTLTWTSDNDSVATVGANGIVQGVGGGTTLIRATSADGSVYATCTVSVSAPVIEEPDDIPTGIVDLDTDVSSLKQTIASLKEAIAAAEAQDALNDGLLLGEIPEQGESEFDPDAYLPGTEEDTRTKVAKIGTVSFAVTVQDKEGQPVNDARLVLKSASGKTVSTAGLISDGQYIFESILSGSYTVEMTDANGNVQTKEIVLTTDAQPDEVVFTLGEGKIGLQGRLATVLALSGVGLVIVALAAVAISDSLRKKRRKK